MSLENTKQALAESMSYLANTIDDKSSEFSIHDPKSKEMYDKALEAINDPDSGILPPLAQMYSRPFNYFFDNRTEDAEFFADDYYENLGQLESVASHLGLINYAQIINEVFIQKTADGEAHEHLNQWFCNHVQIELGHVRNLISPSESEEKFFNYNSERRERYIQEYHQLVSDLKACSNIPCIASEEAFS